MTTATPTPVQCPRCRGPFLPPTMEPAAVIECPHCGHRLRVIDWGRPAPPAAAKTRRSWVAALTGGGMVAVAAALAVWFLETRRPAAANPRQPAEITPAELEAAFTVASRALASESWASALPFIRQSGRVEPLMRRYHAAHPWIPTVLTRSREGRPLAGANRRWAAFSCDTDRGRTIEVRTEDTPSGWKLDWEALTDAPGFEWAEFYAQAPGGSRRLRVSALRGSVPDDYFSKAGVDPESTLAVRLFATERGDSVMALVSKASELGHLFRLELTWEVPRSYVCDLRFADAKAVPPRVEMTAFVKKGWDLSE